MGSTGATKCSSPNSGGRTAVRCDPDKSVKEEDVDSSPFQEAEKVLAFHGPCLYDAKVQRAEFRKDEWKYFVHYHGWKKHWDEWLGVDSLLKCTEENVQKQKELMEKHGVGKNGKPGRLSLDKTKNTVGVRGRKRKYEIIDKECATSVDKLNIQIPSTLKKQLVDDHECITHLGKLVKLPRSPNVSEILHNFFNYQLNKDGKIHDPAVEIVDGLRVYFDKALPAMLLYKQERQQYEEVMADNVNPSKVYGAEHLLRLFVKLPELLSSMNIKTEALAELQQRLQDALRFLQTNQSVYFDSNYQKLPGDSAVKQEEN